MHADEINFDGLVGPTHNYGGLSIGNLASMQNYGAASNPKAAVLQGIQKMRTMMDLGLKQGILPPHERVHIPTLKRFGYSGSDASILEAAWKAAPSLVMNTASASNMWTANAGTISPSADTEDGRVHFTAANLASKFHRAIETKFTSRSLKTIFQDETFFAHHTPVPKGGGMGDEGAANHGRFAPEHGAKGVQLFVYGKSAFASEDGARFEARQALEASQTIALQHGLSTDHTVFIQQARAAIDAGAFHNDVVSVTNGSVLLYHEQAFEHKKEALESMRNACAKIELTPIFVEVPAAQVSLEDAIQSYLFNSQLITLPNGDMTLILPKDAEENDHTRTWVESCLAGNTPIKKAIFLDLKQSMRNGGGPACLRLRVTLTEAEQTALKGRGLMTPALCDDLEKWAEKHYRDNLKPNELGDPSLLQESRTALDELTGLLNLGSLYDFQRG